MAAPDKNPQSDLQPDAFNPALPDRQPMHQSQFSQGQADRGPTIPGITNPEHSRMRQQMQGLWQQEMRPRQMGRDGVTGGQLTTQVCMFVCYYWSPSTALRIYLFLPGVISS